MMRLDQYASSNLRISREKARAMILAGEILLEGEPITKPSFSVSGEPKISATALPRYVGRGGLKLEHALVTFDINPSGLTCLDVGASTGGFTDCLLKFGAARVFAVENGTGQLDLSLIEDERVVSLEKTDIRDPELAKVIPRVDFSCVDVSFISLRQVISPILPLLKPGADIVCLVKPQFEAGRENVSKNGVVRDKKAHYKVISDILSYVKQINLTVKNLTFSPITGGEGNIEYLIHLKNLADDGQVSVSADEIIEKAFQTLRKG